MVKLLILLLERSGKKCWPQDVPHPPNHFEAAVLEEYFIKCFGMDRWAIIIAEPARSAMVQSAVEYVEAYTANQLSPSERVGSAFKAFQIPFILPRNTIIDGTPACYFRLIGLLLADLAGAVAEYVSNITGLAGQPAIEAARTQAGRFALQAVYLELQQRNPTFALDNLRTQDRLTQELEQKIMGDVELLGDFAGRFTYPIELRRHILGSSPPLKK